MSRASRLNGRVGQSDVAATYAGLRAPTRFDPTGKPDGAIGSKMDTGQAVTTFASPSAPSPLSLGGGVIAHTPYNGVQSAGYVQADLGARVRRIGCMASWATNALGVVALVIPSAPWSTGVLPNAGFHLSLQGNGIWTLIRFTTGGSTTLASYQTHGRPSNFWGLGMVPLDIWIDPDNNKAVINWPDGSCSVISSTYFNTETANYAIWELFENNGATDVPAVLGPLWASSDPVTADVPFATPYRAAVGSTAPAVYNVTGALACDFSKALTHEVTLVGNVTSLTLSNPPSRNTIMHLELVQDGTGSRTLAGANSAIKWAGGAAPTLTTTAGRRDIFRFRHNGSGYYEVSRSMNVG